MINLTFSNDNESIALKFVKSVEWQTEASEDTFIGKKARSGKTTRTITVKGFINKGIIDANIKAQVQLEQDLVRIGFGKITYTDSRSFYSVRFLGIEFEEYRGNPIAPFTIRFRTEEANIHAHYTVVVGELVLAPTYGYEHPTVVESTSSQGPDEGVSSTKAKSIKIEGSIVNENRDLINESQQKLIDELSGVQTVTLTLSNDSGSYTSTQTVRPQKVEFSAPSLRGAVTARRYSLEFSTYEDYTKEPYTLGESAATIAGITIDLIEQFDNQKEYERSSTGTNSLIEEDLTVSGKKYFTSYSEYETFRAIFNPIPSETYLYTSPSSNVLDLTNIDIGKFERDGNFASNAKRYSSQITLSFSWKKTIQQTSYEALVNRFGVSFYKIPSITFSAQVDGFGNVTSRSLSITGSVKGTTAITTLRSLVGTTVNYDAPYTNLVVNSVSVGSVTTVNDSGAATSVYEVTLSANQLDTVGQANSFIRSLFRMERAGSTGTSTATDSIQFENVSNISKSLSNRFDTQTQRFIVTSINYSISGEIFDADLNGKPANPNKMIDILNRIDALLTANKSTQSAANTTVTGEALPSNSDIFYFLSNFSVGNWQPAIAPENLPASNGAKGARYWKQSVSISATAVFDITNSGSQNEPDSQESKSIDFTKESPKFTQLQVANFGTVFKRIGTNPERVVVTYEKKFKSASVYVGNDYGADDVVPTGWAGLSDAIITKDTREQRNLVNRHTVEYQATRQLNP